MGDMHKAKLTLATRVNSRSPRPRVYGPDTQEEHKVKLTRAIAKNKQEATRISNAAKQAEADKLRGTSPVTRRKVAPTVSPGTREKALNAITEPDYRSNPYHAGSKPSKRRVRTVSFEERPSTITSERIKPVYPLTDPEASARETLKAADDSYPDSGLKKGQNPIRSKAMDITIVAGKKRKANIERTAATPTQSFERRNLESQMVSDSETPAQRTAKEALRQGREKAAVRTVARSAPHIPPAPSDAWPTSKPPQVALDINAEKARRAADAERDLRIKTYKRQVGQAVSSNRPWKNREKAPAEPSTGPQIKTNIAGGHITPGEAAWRSTFGAVEPFGGIMPNNPDTIARLGSRPGKVSSVSRITTDINIARAKLASNPVLNRLGRGVGRLKGPVITNPTDLLTEYADAGRAAREAKMNDVRFLRGKSVGSFPGTTNKPRIPPMY